MPRQSVLAGVAKKELKKAFGAIAKGKATVSAVAQQFKVSESTVRYHAKAGTYA
jgi:predicted transcriptional regulator